MLNDTIDEVIDVAAVEGIDAHIRKGGELLLACNAAQLNRLEALAAEQAKWPEDDAVGLSGDETNARVRVAGALGGIHISHCARIHRPGWCRGWHTRFSGSAW
jgi:hypothetical protein